MAPCRGGVAVAGVLVALVGAAVPPRLAQQLIEPTPAPEPDPEDPTPDPSIPSKPTINTSGMLSSVDCIRYIIVSGSDAEIPFKAQMEKLGLWDRIVVQVQPIDPDGKTAGAFHAHQSAWEAGLEGGCKNLLVLEEDAEFDPRAMDPAVENVDRFLKEADGDYDMFFLGWGTSFLFTGHVGKVMLNPTEFTTPCVYNIHHWLLMQSYVISPSAMARYVKLQYNTTATGAPKGLPIDNLLSMQEDRNKFYVVYPMIVLQSDHEIRSAGRKGKAAIVADEHALLDEEMAIPGDVHYIENELYSLSGISPPKSCHPSLVADPEETFTPYGLPHYLSKASLFLPPNTTNVDPLSQQNSTF